MGAWVPTAYGDDRSAGGHRNHIGDAEGTTFTSFEAIYEGVPMIIDRPPPPLWRRLLYRTQDVWDTIRFHVGWQDIEAFYDAPFGWPVTDLHRDEHDGRVFVVPWRWLARIIIWFGREHE